MWKHAAVLLLMLGLGVGGIYAVPAVPAGDQEKVAQLVAQLGSANFRQREAAARELDAFGEPALEALRAASKSSDMEVANRAAGLVAKIEQRAAAAKLLAPTYVDLSLKEVSIDQALAELSKQSGYNVILGGDKSKLNDRRVTIETGKVPFWQALDMICAKANLVEASPANQVGGVIDQQGVPVQGKFFIPNRQAIDPTGKTIVLVDGQQPLPPTCADGAVRIRALTDPKQLAGYGPISDREIGLLFEVRAEPKMQVVEVLGVKIDKATDNYDQNLDQSTVAANQGDPNAPAVINGQIQAKVVGQVFITPNWPQPGTASHVPARLKKADKESKSIQELKGAVAVKVRTPEQEILSVGNIMKAKGESAKGQGDSSLQIVGVQQEKNGDIKIEVELRHANDITPKGAAAAAPLGGLQIQGNVQIQIGNGQGGIAMPVQFGNMLGLELLDENGKAIPNVGVQQTKIDFGPTHRTTAAFVTFRPKKDQEPAKLAFMGSGIASVDVPFTLKDVPVTK